MSPIVECWFCAFQNVKSELGNIEFRDASTAHPKLAVYHLAVNDLIGISDNSEVSIMGHNYSLPSAGGFMNSWN